MYKWTGLLFLVFLLASCQSEATTEQEGASASQGETQRGHINIQTITDYSPAFVNNLKHALLDIAAMNLIGNKLVTEAGDTLLFPPEPPIGRELTFRGGEAGEEVELKVQRANQSTVRYAIILNLKEGGTYEMKGLADLLPGFFTTPASDTDDQTGTTYPIAIFNDAGGECNNSIRVGQANDGHSYRAKLVMNCIDMELSLAETPTLSAEQ